MMQLIDIAEFFAGSGNFTVEELRSKSRKYDITRWRQLFCLIARESGFTYTSISTYLHMCRSGSFKQANTAKNEISIYKSKKQLYEHYKEAVNALGTSKKAG